jgi:pyroglutamyl-peptidase
VPRAARRDITARPLRILVSGFEPFGGEAVNPAEQLVRTLTRRPPPDARVRLVGVILPVDRDRFRPHLDHAITRHRPDALLAVGQATGRSAVDLETYAHNCLDYRGERDNGGHAAAGEALEAGSPERLRASLPLRALHHDLQRLGLPVRLSNDAGRHLCNALLYHLLLRHATLPAGFVHVPLLPRQAAQRGRGEAHLPEAVSLRCLEALIRRLADRLPAGSGTRGQALPPFRRKRPVVHAGVRAGRLPRPRRLDDRRAHP